MYRSRLRFLYKIMISYNLISCLNLINLNILILLFSNFFNLNPELLPVYNFLRFFPIKYRKIILFQLKRFLCLLEIWIFNIIKFFINLPNLIINLSLKVVIESLANPTSLESINFFLFIFYFILLENLSLFLIFNLFFD